MAKQDLRDLGFAEGEAPAPKPAPKPKAEKRRIESEGYLAGMKRFEDSGPGSGHDAAEQPPPAAGSK